MLWFGLQVYWRVCLCEWQCCWRSSDLSREWQKEENGFLRAHNAHRGCLYSRPHKAQGIYMVTARESSLYNVDYKVTLPGNPANCSLPLLCSVQVCGHHMALLPSFLASELATMWHVANPACICLAFCYPKHKKDGILRPQQHIVTYRSQSIICPFLVPATPSLFFSTC